MGAVSILASSFNRRKYRFPLSYITQNELHKNKVKRLADIVMLILDQHQKDNFN